MTRPLNLLLLPVLFMPLLASGATWYVDASMASSGDGTTWEAAFKTIQEGIDAAAHGDTVIVAPGTYAGSIRFHGKNISLASADPLDPSVVAATTIQYGHPVVAFYGTEDESCTLSGFTITRGSLGIGGWGSSGRTHATVENNVITLNQANAVGAGIACCDGVIRNNIISANWGFYGGGGLAYCHGVIQNNIISGNCAGPGGPPSLLLAVRSGERRTDVPTEVRPGAGLYCCDGVIRNNIIVGNRARGYNGGIFMIEGWGGGLAECNGVIEGNVISDNFADMGDGGGLYSCNGVIRNNTIVSNSADNGGGLSACRGAIRNCIIFGNAVFFAGAQLHASSDPTYSCIQDWTGGGEGNINLEPRFVDAENTDFRLLPDSPCRNAGNTVAVLEVTLSLVGNGALISWSGGDDADGNPCVSGAAVDIGAYEYQEGPPSLGFVVEYSPDLSFWESIDVGSAWQWLDEMPDGLGSGFYRIGVR